MMEWFSLRWVSRAARLKVPGLRPRFACTIAGVGVAESSLRMETDMLMDGDGEWVFVPSGWGSDRTRLALREGLQLRAYISDCTLAMGTSVSGCCVTVSALRSTARWDGDVVWDM